MSTVVYSSLSDKQARYVRLTIPLIFLRASEAVNAVPYPNTPQRIHETARAGNYVAEYGPKDEVLSVEETLRDGGDCEDWAVYQLAAAYTHGIGVRLVTAGDDADHFAHVYVEFKDPQTGRWQASNPKGDQPGMDYKLPSRWPVKRRWALDSHGRVYELTATNVDGAGKRNRRYQRSRVTRVAGSGARKPDPILRSYADAASWLGPLWTSKIRQVEVPGHSSRVTLLEGGLWAMVHRAVHGQVWAQGSLAGEMRNGRGDLRLSTVLAFIRDNIGRLNPQIREPLRALWESYTWPDLDDVNLDQAAAWSAGMLQSSEGRAAIREQARVLGAKPEAGDEKKAILVAAAAAKTATGAGVELNRFHEAHRELKTGSREPDVQAVIELAKDKFGRIDRSPPPPGTTDSVDGSGRELVGSGSIFSEFIEDVGDFGRGVIKEVGKGVRRFARNILNVDRDLPWLSQFVLRPLFVMGHMRTLEQLGEAMVQGTTAAFDAKAVGVDFARDLTASGTALIAASPFIPQPWGTLAAAVGVIFVAGGQLALEALNPNSALNTGKLGQDQVVTVDQYGRQIGPDGLPVDPFQRQLELQRQAGLEPNPSEQTAGEWRAGSDGLLYGWSQLGTENWYWLALALDQQQQITGAWYWTADAGGGRPGWGQLA